MWQPKSSTNDDPICWCLYAPLGLNDGKTANEWITWWKLLWEILSVSDLLHFSHYPLGKPLHIYQASHVYQARCCTGQVPHPQGAIGYIIDGVGDLNSESWQDTGFPFAYNCGRIYCEIGICADKESDYLGVRFHVFSECFLLIIKPNKSDEQLRIAWGYCITKHETFNKY